MVKRMIFAWYILPNDLENIIYKHHLAHINASIELMDIYDFYLLIDNINDVEKIEYTKHFILSRLNTDHHYKINFYTVQNEDFHFEREGKIYVDAFLYNLKEYADNNEIVMFGHTKGLTNPDIDNSIKWLAMIYFPLMWDPYYMGMRLIESKYKNVIAFGPLYNYSKSNTSIYKWIYYGGFSAVNARRLYDHLIANNIEYTSHIYSIPMNIRISAEEFLPNVLTPEQVSFYNEECYNKYTNLITYERANFPYHKIEYIGALHMNVNTWYNYVSYRNKIIEIVNNEITNNI